MEFQPLLRNQISGKSRIRSPQAKFDSVHLFPDIDSIIVPAGPGTGLFRLNSAMDGRVYLMPANRLWKGGGAE